MIIFDRFLKEIAKLRFAISEHNKVLRNNHLINLLRSFVSSTTLEQDCSDLIRAILKKSKVIIDYLTLELLIILYKY